VFAEIVHRIAVLVRRRPSRDDVGVPLRNRVRIDALQPVQQRRIPVQVIEVLEQPEAQDLGDVGIRLILRQRGGDLDGHLLIPDRRFEWRLIGGQQPVDQRLLMLLLAPDPGQRGLQVLVHAGAGMAETNGLRFDAVHENDAHPRKGIDVQFADRLLHHILPGKVLLVDRRSFVL
jgi:hypothetical protein